MLGIVILFPPPRGKIGRYAKYRVGGRKQDKKAPLRGKLLLARILAKKHLLKAEEEGDKSNICPMLRFYVLDAQLSGTER